MTIDKQCIELSIIYLTHFSPTISLVAFAVSPFLRVRASPFSHFRALLRLLSHAVTKYRDGTGEFELLVSNTSGLLYPAVKGTRIHVRNR